MREYTEKRNHRRIPLECQVQFRLPDDDRMHYGRSKNLSVGGIAFKSSSRVRPGQLLELKLMPPKGSTVLPLQATLEVTRLSQTETDCEIAGFFRKVEN